MNLSFEELINEYINCAKLHFNIDYGKRKSVAEANRAVDKMIRISKLVSNKYSHRIGDFAKLLEIKEYRTDLWVAHHLLENMVYPLDIEDKALDVIFKYSNDNSTLGLGNRIWLENWYNTKKTH